MRIWLTVGFATMCVPIWAAMPASAQNKLVKQYCEVCHTDAVRNGGLSLESYDAAKPDPTLAAMILSKLNDGAMGAAGNGVPDKAAQEAWLTATREQAVGAAEWFVSREDGLVSASITREVPSRRADVSKRPIYRIKVACNTISGVGQMQLTWSPQAQTGRTMTVSVDREAPVEYSLDGKESMGNGANVQSGHASLLLSDNGKAKLPNHSMTVRELFPGETVAFPFSDLDGKARTDLSACFNPPPQH